MEISDELIDKLVDKFVDLLTDKIAEKVAEKIYKDSIPIPNTPTPVNPPYPPYPDRKRPLDMIAVMYGVVSTPYKDISGINTINSSKYTTAFTNQTEIKD